DEEATVMFAGRDGKEFPRVANRNGFFEIGFLRRGERHFYSREDEEPAEEVNHPVETFDQRDSAENKNGAHDESAEDSPEKDLMLVLRRDVKRGEDQDEDENIIDRKAFLDQVAGKKLQPLLAAHEMPDSGSEKSRQCNPDSGTSEG